MKGQLIAFSGLDGAGKSTQIELLLRTLAAEGRTPVYLWVRGGYTPLFNTLKETLRRLSKGRALPPSGRNAARNRAFARPWVRQLWLRLAMLDLLWVYGIRVRAWLLAGKTVVCDRYLWDTLVDFRLNFPADRVEEMWLWRLLARVSPRPSAAFLMLVPVDESLRRSRQKAEPFPDSAETLTARREQYLSLAASAGWTMLDGTLPIQILAGQILDAVSSQPPCGVKVAA